MPITGFAVGSTITVTSLTLTWEISGGGYSHVRITQNIDSAADIDDTRIYLEPKGVDGTKTFTLTGLSPATTYHFYIYGANSDGTIFGSSNNWLMRNTKSVSATTLSGIPDAPGAPTYVLSGTPGTDQTIALTWTAPTNRNGGAITGYQIQRAVETKSGETFSVGAFADVVANTGDATLTYTDSTSGLDTTANGYFYRVRAITSRGRGAWSSDTGTVVGTAPDANTATATVDLADRTITVGWTAVTNDKNAGIIYYDAEVINTDDGTDAESSGFTDITGETSWESPALTQGEQYKIALTIRNAAGSATITLPNPNTFDISSGIPDAPGTPTYVITGTPGTNQTIALTWADRKSVV